MDCEYIVAERTLVENIYSYLGKEKVQTEQHKKLQQELANTLQAQDSSNQLITNPSDVAKILLPMLYAFEQEHLIVVTLTTRNQVISVIDLYTGTINSSRVRPAEVFRAALKDNAASIILAHNHPSGDPSPSPDDVVLTSSLCELGNKLELPILDHMVFGGGKYYSIKGSNPAIFV
jgi:DNA repair protein RadC